ncbi:MAG: hypothetical protein JSU94_07175 [Phycisphaerales bacterium]|nr:MAG: hypothetical protein JSU94_07175 [Phycisphaerales bacterium]
MKKSDISYIAGCVFAVGTAFFYCCTMWFSIRLPRYFPLEHVWRWGKVEGSPSQGWYGMQGFAYVFGGVAALAVYVLLKRGGLKAAELKPATTRWLGVGAAVVVVLCMGYMLYHEFDKWGIF